MRLSKTGCALALLAVAGCHTPPPITQLKGTSNWTPDSAHARELTEEETNANGIEVGAPKTYDDASLRLMLDATRAKLAAMTGLNQGALTASLGSISGATINQSQFGLQVGPTSFPSSIATTSAGPTTSTTTNAGLPAANTSVPGTVTVTTDPTQSSTVTTSVTPPVAPTVPPGLAFTPPGTISPSSLDMLNEQMQLSSAITGLELLLEGAISDRFVINQRIVKPRVTLGFPISLRAPAAYKDAVAVVEVEVTTTRTLGPKDVPDPPAITALLPQEKTYNVAAMTDKMTSVGAGVVIGTVGVGASGTWGHKTFFLVQDQDTVALQRPASLNPEATSFLWEFHPVLGQHYVRGGMKQTFVQLALPVLEHRDCYGSLLIRTYWRRFDQKNGIVGDVIPESVLVHRPFPIARYDLAPAVDAVTYEDLGDGNLSVTVRGQYLAGTYVQFGSTRFEAGKNLIVEDSGVKFTVPAAAVGLWTGHVAARSGEASDLLTPLAQTPLRVLNQTACVDLPPAKPCPKPPAVPAAVPPAATCVTLFIRGVEAQPLNESDSLIRVHLGATPRNDSEEQKLLLLIGNKVFGLRDAPVLRGREALGAYIVARVPTALLVSNPRVRVFSPFWSDVDGDGQHCYDASESLRNQFGPDSSVERLVLVSVDEKSGDACYILYGNGLAQASLLVPDSLHATLKPIPGVSGDRMQILIVKKPAIATTKKVVLQKASGQRPILLDLPPLKATPIKVSADSPVIQGTQKLDVKAEQAKEIDTVKMKDKTLHWIAVDESAIQLTSLKSDGVTDEQRSAELTIAYKNGDKATLKLEVVAARVGVRTEDKPTNASSDSSSSP
jgi:hypothetical protein